MPDANGQELRARREALGLSLDQLAEITAVPVDYLRALEVGAYQELPPGPYAKMYSTTVQRALARFEQSGVPDGGPPTHPSLASDPGAFVAGRLTGAGVDDASDHDGPVVHTRPVPTAAGEPGGVPLPVVRVLAMVSTSVLVLLLIGQGVASWRSLAARPADVGPAPIEVKVKLRSNATLRVAVDGQLVAHRQFAGGDVVTWTGRERVEVDVPNLSAAWIWFDGRSISPRGNQDRPRTLAFINDRVAP